MTIEELLQLIGAQQVEIVVLRHQIKLLRDPLTPVGE